jgi:membrane-associated protein
MIAGTSRMPLRKYATANIVGAAIWAVGVSLLGFWLGKSIDIDKWIYPIVAVIIVLSLIPPYLEYRRHKRSQASAT